MGEDARASASSEAERDERASEDRSTSKLQSPSEVLRRRDLPAAKGHGSDEDVPDSLGIDRVDDERDRTERDPGPVDRTGRPGDRDADPSGFRSEARDLARRIDSPGEDTESAGTDGTAPVHRSAETGAAGATGGTDGSPPSDGASTPELVREVVASDGHGLDGATRSFMESRMGESFGDVRLHTGPRAAAAAEAIDARAFTVGNHIAFNRGEYDPSSREGRHVIAHELAHVRQDGPGTPEVQRLQKTEEVETTYSFSELEKLASGGGDLTEEQQAHLNQMIDRMILDRDTDMSQLERECSRMVQRYRQSNELQEKGSDDESGSGRSEGGEQSEGSEQNEQQTEVPYGGWTWIHVYQMDREDLENLTPEAERELILFVHQNEEVAQKVAEQVDRAGTAPSAGDVLSSGILGSAKAGAATGAGMLLGGPMAVAPLVMGGAIGGGTEFYKQQVDRHGDRDWSEYGFTKLGSIREAANVVRGTAEDLRSDHPMPEASDEVPEEELEEEDRFAQQVGSGTDEETESYQMGGEDWEGTEEMAQEIEKSREEGVDPSVEKFQQLTADQWMNLSDQDRSEYIKFAQEEGFADQLFHGTLASLTGFDKITPDAKETKEATGEGAVPGTAGATALNTLKQATDKAPGIDVRTIAEKVKSGQVIGLPIGIVADYIISKLDLDDRLAEFIDSLADEGVYVKVESIEQLERIDDEELDVDRVRKVIVGDDEELRNSDKAFLVGPPGDE